MSNPEMMNSDGLMESSSQRLDAELQKEIDEALGDMSVMDLVDPTVSVVAGQDANRRTGRVVEIQAEEILVDLGGKSTGILPLKHWGDEPIPAVGDNIEVVVTGYEQGEGLILLSRQDAVTAAAWETLQVGQVVEGRVTGHNKGGLELVVDGIKGFMPISQIERFRVEEELAPYVNQKLQAKILEIRRKEKSLVLSRRDLLNEQAFQARTDLLNTLEEGRIVRGTVKNIMPYGAFVDLGGADGLLHVKDMGYMRVADPASVVTVGQELEVMVLKVDRSTQKIALGLKQVMKDPWSEAAQKWTADSVVSGRITRLMDFGAFLELEPGVEGLIPIGEMTFQRRINHPREVVNENEVVKVRVMSVDIARKRISLSLKRVGDDPWIGASVRWAGGTVTEGTVRRLADFGAFVELAPGVEGLVHISELAPGRVQRVADVVQEGQLVKIKVLEVDEERRRIALSIKQAHEQLTPTEDWSQYVATGATNAAMSDATAKKRKKPLRGGLDR
ncbi:MAG: 30S ribosomal protein S1 [Phycisphaerae bacterium]|nr:30S ribosomal protein S1 [Phycisphaerae bacterium]